MVHDKITEEFKIPARQGFNAENEVQIPLSEISGITHKEYADNRKDVVNLTTKDGQELRADWTLDTLYYEIQKSGLQFIDCENVESRTMILANKQHVKMPEQDVNTFRDGEDVPCVEISGFRDQHFIVRDSDSGKALNHTAVNHIKIGMPS